MALWLAARDPLTPLGARNVAGTVAAYALSPIDLIPDVIPVLGYLDDLLIVALGIWTTIRLIPARLLAEFQAAASDRSRPTSRAAAMVVIGLWLFSAVLVGAWFWRTATGP